MEQLEHIIAEFEIGDPIKSLFRPLFTKIYNIDHDKFYINLRITAPDAYKPGESITVHLQTELPSHLQHGGIYSPVAYKRMVADFLRDQLHFMIKHEVDESIKLAGRRIYDPHAAELPITKLS